MGGYKRQLLEIDLATGKSKVRRPKDELYSKFLGGRGLGARLLYDLLPPGTDALSADNVLMILTGPLTGTIVPGGGKYVVVTKSPVSNGYVDSYASGRIAVELKFAGYDGIIMRGKASKPSYIYINNDIVEVRDASFLWGKDTFATEEFIRKDLADDDVGILCIGPAGEKMVKFATINSDYYRQAGRGGVGAVMGSKNVKAVVVKGNRGVDCADIARVLETVQKHMARIENSPVAKSRIEYGTPLTLDMTSAAGMLPTSNFRRGIFTKGFNDLNAEAVKGSTIKSRGCYGCIVGCSKITKVQEGIFKGKIVEGPEYETLSLLGSNLEINKLPAIIQSNILCDSLGLDTISTGNVIGFLMECKEKGYLRPDDVNGLNLNFGNYEAVLQLIEDIAYRRGVGDFLAEGVRFVADKVGRDSTDFAMHIKGLEFPAYDPRIGYGTALAYAVSPRGACHRRAWPPAVEVLGKEKPYEVEGKAKLVKTLYDENSVFHSLLVCDFPAKWVPLKVSDFSEYLTMVTGSEFREDELWEIADRIETQIRLFNNREGLSRKDDTLPPRAFKEGIKEGPAQGHYIPQSDFEVLLDEYYALRGWDNAGVPKPETVARLQLELERGEPFCD